MSVYLFVCVCVCVCVCSVVCTRALLPLRVQVHVERISEEGDPDYYINLPDKDVFPDTQRSDLSNTVQCRVCYNGTSHGVM